MTTHIRTTQTAEHIGQRVKLKGWLHARRRMGGVTFLILRDGWGTIQAVCASGEAIEALERAGAGVESVVEVEGTPAAQSRAPGGVELIEPALTVISPVREAAPVTINKPTIQAGQAAILDHAPLTLRHPARRAIFRMSAEAMAGFRATLGAQGFTEIQSPKIVASATESGANVFGIDYFGTRAYLAQSPQFYKQIMVGVFERVFEVGPVFRAEPHATPRHINEYVSLDIEMGFIENHFSVMAVLRGVLAGMLGRLEETCGAELALSGAIVPQVPERIPHVHFQEAKALLFEATGEDTREEPDLSPGEERWLGQWAQRQWGSDFLFVTGYPMVKRPFYTHPEAGDSRWSNSFDLLFRGMELVTGGQRLHLFESYVEALKRAGMPQAPFEHYLEAFRFGMPPHGGFAIGLERFLMQLTGESNLRATTLFPRDLHRLSP